jgi:hypothetical protein
VAILKPLMMGQAIQKTPIEETLSRLTTGPRRLEIEGPLVDGCGQGEIPWPSYYPHLPASPVTRSPRLVPPRIAARQVTRKRLVVLETSESSSSWRAGKCTPSRYLPTWADRRFLEKSTVLLLVGYLDFRSSGFAEAGPLIGPTTMYQVCKAPEQQQEYSTKMIRRINA